MKKAIDRRAARTRRALHDAMISLILRKGYEATTIQDIIDEADVGRSTFYAHYTGKEDLLRGGFERLRTDLTEARDSYSPRRRARRSEPLVFSLAMFQHADGYKDVYRALVGRRGGAVAVSEIRRVLSEFVRQELSTVERNGAIPRELALQFIVSAFLTVLTWWLERKPELAPTAVDEMFRRLVIKGIGSSTGLRVRST
ncbi:TetR family transcriptional regulator [Bradyrhizobium sp. CSA207]|uniref:TetR/AcrR family transcriptional regulator n=1 Tax=Bradyrhizobium sp. CSA207 TaxID=2698826 RepID=UPI0023B147F1|nr:TetR/AcrR family transcriptional regulator [Bradyrhizobium sp. CSA207]MDE5443128.1 TetR family transcriptional regulator [Bradyrhizobium sp. CSA207]